MSRFQTHKQPVTEYEAIREKAASQKRDIEKALTKFLAKTSETHNLFNTDDNQVFPCRCRSTSFLIPGVFKNIFVEFANVRTKPHRLVVL